MRVAVGCPVFERAWSLPAWFDSVEAQGFEPLYHFVYTPGQDETLEVIREWAPHARVVVADDLPRFRNDARMDTTRYHVLAELRNRLLASVRTSDADWFLSWDSDVIFEPDTLHHLFIGKPVVGALLDMLGVNWLMSFPSVMDFHERNGASRRGSFADYESDGVTPFQVDVVMAVVLMERLAFERVRYEGHPLGEDIGFAIRCEELGIERWLAPSAIGEHWHDRT